MGSAFSAFEASILHLHCRNHPDLWRASSKGHSLSPDCKISKISYFLYNIWE